MQTEKKVFQLAQLCSQIVFIIFGGGLKKRKFPVKFWSKLKSKTGPSMLRNRIESVFDSGKWSILTFLAFLERSHSRCKKNKIFEKQKRKKRLGPVFDSNKGRSWTSS